ncbi:MAG: TRAP transporter substrate-binding protein DctP, partial [Oscillibacter sp.]|nr:TRAP transporter substrate-binding protein DctP [Oscillibacter sp.]
MKKLLSVFLALSLTLALTACGGSGAPSGGGSSGSSDASGGSSDEVYELKVPTTQTQTSMIYKGLQAAAGLRVLCYNYYDGARSFMGPKEYKTPADLKGVVCRTPGADPYVKSIEALGATAYNVAWSEVYNSIQTKAIDACEVQYTSAVSSKIFEVCDYVSKTEHINLFNFVVCGEAWFNKLPAEYQQILKDDFFSCAYDNAQEIIAAQADLEQQLVEGGMTIVDVDLDAFKEAAKTAYEQLGWTELREQVYQEAGIAFSGAERGG